MIQIGYFCYYSNVNVRITFEIIQNETKMNLLTHEGWCLWFWPEISRLCTQSVLLDSHAQYSGVPMLGTSMSTFTPWDSSSSTHAVWPKTCTHRHPVYWNLKVYSALLIHKNHHIPLFAASWRGELSRWAGWWAELYIRMRLTRAGFPLQHALKRGVAPSKETAFAWMHIYCSH